MTDLSSLISRVEEGEGADFVLDGEVWKALTEASGDNWRQFDDVWHLQDVEDTVAYEPPPLLTTSLDAVVSLIEQKLPGWFWRVGHGSHAGPWAHLNRVHPDSCLPEDEATSYAKSPARALLAACLKSLSALEERADG